MAEARSKQLWDHTSHVLAWLVNVNKAKGDPVSPRQFHPHYQQPDPVERLTPRQTMDMLRRWYETRKDQRAR